MYYGAMQILFMAQSGLAMLIYATKINDHSSDIAAAMKNPIPLVLDTLSRSCLFLLCYPKSNSNVPNILSNLLKS